MTAKIINFPGHRLHGPQDHIGVEPDPYGRDCIACTLSFCTRCHGGEGALPSDCPGRPLTFIESALIYDMKLDFRHPVGWTNKPSEVWQKWR